MSKQENYLIKELLNVTLQPFQNAIDTPNLSFSVDEAMLELGNRLSMCSIQWRIMDSNIEAEVWNPDSRRRKCAVKVRIISQNPDIQHYDSDECKTKHIKPRLSIENLKIENKELKVTVRRLETELSELRDSYAEMLDTLMGDKHE